MMSARKKLLEEIYDQFLVCKICFDVYTRPKTLSCLHTFCEDCIEKHQEAELERAYRYLLYSSRTITCPICRKKTDLPPGGVRRLPDNLIVPRLADMVGAGRVTHGSRHSKVSVRLSCEICKGTSSRQQASRSSSLAVSKCLDCCKVLCASCNQLHKRTKVTEFHSTVDIEVEDKDVTCKMHDGELVRFYCESCACCICVVCAFQEPHKGHDVSTFSEAIAKHRHTLDSLLIQCKQRADHLRSQLELAGRWEIDTRKVEEQVRHAAIECIESIRDREKQLVAELHTIFSDNPAVQSFIADRPVIEATLRGLDATCQLTDLIVRDRSVELLLLKDDIANRMQSLLQTTLTSPPSQLLSNSVRFATSKKWRKLSLGQLDFGVNKLQSSSESELEELNKHTNSDKEDKPQGARSKVNSRSSLTRHKRSQLTANFQPIINQLNQTTMTSPSCVVHQHSMTSDLPSSNYRSQNASTTMNSSVHIEDRTVSTSHRHQYTETEHQLNATSPSPVQRRNVAMLTEPPTTFNKSTLTEKPFQLDKTVSTSRVRQMTRDTNTPYVVCLDMAVDTAHIPGHDKACATRVIVTTDAFTNTSTMTSPLRHQVDRRWMTSHDGQLRQLVNENICCHERQDSGVVCDEACCHRRDMSACKHASSDCHSSATNTTVRVNTSTSTPARQYTTSCSNTVIHCDSTTSTPLQYFTDVDTNTPLRQYKSAETNTSSAADISTNTTSVLSTCSYTNTDELSHVDVATNTLEQHSHSVTTNTDSAVLNNMSTNTILTGCYPSIHSNTDQILSARRSNLIDIGSGDSVVTMADCGTQSERTNAVRDIGTGDKSVDSTVDRATGDSLSTTVDMSTETCLVSTVDRGTGSHAVHLIHKNEATDSQSVADAATSPADDVTMAYRCLVAAANPRPATISRCTMTRPMPVLVDEHTSTEQAPKMKDSATSPAVDVSAIYRGLVGAKVSCQHRVTVSRGTLARLGSNVTTVDRASSPILCRGVDKAVSVNKASLAEPTDVFVKTATDTASNVLHRRLSGSCPRMDSICELSDECVSSSSDGESTASTPSLPTHRKMCLPRRPVPSVQPSIETLRRFSLRLLQKESRVKPVSQQPPGRVDVGINTANIVSEDKSVGTEAVMTSAVDGKTKMAECINKLRTVSQRLEQQQNASQHQTTSIHSDDIQNSSDKSNSSSLTQSSGSADESTSKSVLETSSAVPTATTPPVDNDVRLSSPQTKSCSAIAEDASHQIGRRTRASAAERPAKPSLFKRSYSPRGRQKNAQTEGNMATASGRCNATQSKRAVDNRLHTAIRQPVVDEEDSTTASATSANRNKPTAGVQSPLAGRRPLTTDRPVRQTATRPRPDQSTVNTDQTVTKSPAKKGSPRPAVRSAVALNRKPTRLMTLIDDEPRSTSDSDSVMTHSGSSDDSIGHHPSAAGSLRQSLARRQRLDMTQLLATRSLSESDNVPAARSPRTGRHQTKLN